jgi:hypothetical protein
MTIPLRLFKTYVLGQDDEVRYGEFVAGLQETEVFTIEYIDEAEPLQASDAIALLPQHFLREHGESLEPSTRRRIIVLSTEKLMRMVFPDLEYAAEVQWQHSTYAPDAPATTTGFWGQQTIVALMDAFVAFAQGDTHCQFDTIAPQHGAEIIGEYCQVVYGLEWIATLRTAALNRTIAGQSYLTLVGIWESAQRHMRAAEGLEQRNMSTWMRHLHS